MKLLIFAIAFMGCVLATPGVTRLAVWFGAIDRPDQFRRIHKGATPRMGGLGLAFGLALSLLLIAWGGYLRDWDRFAEWWSALAPVILVVVVLATLLILEAIVVVIAPERQGERHTRVAPARGQGLGSLVFVRHPGRLFLFGVGGVDILEF